MEEIPKSPAANYKRGSRALRKSLAQDPQTGMAELELSGELVKLLEQEVCLKCLSTSTGTLPERQPSFSSKELTCLLCTVSKIAGSVRGNGGGQWGSEV